MIEFSNIVRDVALAINGAAVAGNLWNIDGPNPALRGFAIATNIACILLLISFGIFVRYRDRVAGSKQPASALSEDGK